MFYKITIIFIFLFGILINTYTQDDDEEEYYTEEQEEVSPLKRFFWGGNFGLGFGTTTYLEISPLVGYRFTKKVSAACGPIYQYYSYKPYSIKMNIIGGRLYGRYYILNNIFIHIEEDLLFVKSDIFNYPNNEDNNSYKPVNELLVGGGLRQPLGQNSAVNLVVLWNLTESDYIINSNPVIRIDFNF